jgi:hypothetical protein
VSQEIAVVDPELKSDDIKIRNYRTERAKRPDAFGNAGVIETCSDAEGGYCM